MANKYNVMIKGNLKTVVHAESLPDALRVIEAAGLNPEDVTRLEVSKPRIKEGGESQAA